jgi:hypothetical protein
MPDCSETFCRTTEEKLRVSVRAIVADLLDSWKAEQDSEWSPLVGLISYPRKKQVS